MKTFNITIEMLKAKGACMDGMRDFLKHHPEGIDYQELLDDCAQKDRDDYARWLLRAFGSVNTKLEIESINSEKSVFFAGSIIVTGAIVCRKRICAGEGIEAGDGIEAVWGIEAGEGIKAGGGIKAGDGIEAGRGIEAGGGIEAVWGIKAGGGIEAVGGIEAGDDYGIFAGLRVRISMRAEYAKIKAKTKPSNIVCGEYVNETEEST